VPPADGIASLKSAGFVIATGSYPHVWPWFYNIGAANSPFKDVRVRQALNYCIDRDGLVALLSGTAEPSVGWLKSSDPDFGSPVNHYKFDPAKGKALLAEAGYTTSKPLAFKVMISNSGSGQMLPLPMNEFLQQNLKEACGVNVDFDVVEWQVLLTAARATPASPSLQGAQYQLAVVGCRRHGAVFLLREFFAERLQFRTVEGRRIRRRTQDRRRGDRSQDHLGRLPQGA
jgi:peptide/nickel transport system substrate-binding protein